MSIDLKKLGLNEAQLKAAQELLSKNPKATIAEILKHVQSAANPDLRGLDQEPDFKGAQTAAKGARCAGTVDKPDFSKAEVSRQAGARCAGTVDKPDFSKAEVSRQAGARCAGTVDKPDFSKAQTTDKGARSAGTVDSPERKK